MKCSSFLSRRHAKLAAVSWQRLQQVGGLHLSEVALRDYGLPGSHEVSGLLSAALRKGPCPGRVGGLPCLKLSRPKLESFILRRGQALVVVSSGQPSMPEQ